MLRRLKADVERSMPPKTETILFASLTKCQRDVYKSLLKRDASLLGKEDGSCSRASIANIAMQLRKCCNHPYLFQGVEDRTLDPLGEHVIDACGKLKLVDKELIDITTPLQVLDKLPCAKCSLLRRNLGH